MGRSKKKATGSDTRGRPQSSAAAAKGPGARAGLPGGVWAAGLLFLLVAAGAALFLSIDEVSANFNLPGCGESSGCAGIKNAEVFGVKVGIVPVVGWPVSYVGFAYFAAMTAAWGLSGGARRRGPGRFLTGTAFVGGLVSVLFLAAMVIAQKFCVYCFTAHMGNLLFVALVGGWMMRAAGASERPRAEAHADRAASGSRLWPAAAGAAVFIVSAAAFGLLDQGAADKAEARRAEQRAESRQEILDRARASDGGDASSSQTPSETSSTPGNPGVPAAADGASSENEQAASPVRERFAGRWEMGPQQAPIRIVMFSDYQCDLCRATERALIPVVEQSDDIWLSVKHFPWCTDCNRYVSKTEHGNACWAARAAEAAGAIGGPEAFWKMHKWLFERQGKFETTEILRQGIAAAGITDVAAFMAHFNDADRSLAGVKADVEEAVALGITQTPMVFINGVELRGMSHVSQLLSEIEALRGENLPALTAEADRPPTAARKYADLWAEGRDFTGEETLTVFDADWSMGPEAPAVEVVMWGDYKFQGVPEFDRILRDLAAEDPGVRYTFRFYPLERGCNEYLPERPVILQGACRAAQLAEAAGQLGGEEAFWKMHGWLMDNSERALGDFMAKFAAKHVGLDGDAVLARAATSEVASAIAEDSMRKQALDPNNRMPLIIVNGRVVPVSRPEGARELLSEVLRRARGT